MGKIGEIGRISMKIKKQDFDFKTVTNDVNNNNNILVLKSKKLVNLVLCFRFSLAFFLLASCYLYG
jgi:hypothetical protein